jgi:hypothetical protein
VVDDEGRALRPLDVDFAGRTAELDRQSLASTRNGALLALVVCLFGLALTPPIAAVGVVVAQFVWVRLFVVARYRRHFSTTRRIVTRWLSRLVMVFLVGFHLALALPIVQLVASPALFAALCAAAWAYHRWHLQREHDRLPIGLLEKALLVVAALVVLVTLALLILLGGLVSWLAGAFGGGPG